MVIVCSGRSSAFSWAGRAGELYNSRSAVAYLVGSATTSLKANNAVVRCLCFCGAQLLVGAGVIGEALI